MKAREKIDPYLRPLIATVWAQARLLLDGGKPREAEELLAQLQEKYQHSAWLATYATSIAAARELARRCNRAAEAEELYAKAAESFKEGERYTLRPLVEDLEAKYAKSEYLNDPARNPSLAGISRKRFSGSAS